MLPNFEDAASHCLECAEWVTSACAWSGCPFRNPRKNAGAQGSDALRFSPLIPSFHASPDSPKGQ